MWGRARFGLLVALGVGVAACDGSVSSAKLKVRRLAPEADEIVAPDATLEHLAGDFGLLEGPVWSEDGHLLFADMAHHAVYRWADGEGVSIYLRQEGWDAKLPRGPNGLAFDRAGRLLICQHGRRTLVRLESDGSLTVLADRFRGMRLNSPNDLAVRSDGHTYFTDPPFGLVGGYDDPRRELDFSGIFVLFQAELRLVSKQLSAPNGIALSPDEAFVYVSNSDADSPVVMRFEVDSVGGLDDGEVFFDFTHLDVEDSLDGMVTDRAGNLYVSSSAGIIIVNPDGRHLATITLPLAPYNLAWGGADRRSLYITAESSLYRLRLQPGVEMKN
ncbi:MAG: SMP-30/gluconolactonase/LRE family protein [Gammaproteobacteria bacterium]